MGEYANVPSTGQQAGGGTTPAGAAPAGGTTADPGTGTGTAPAPAAGGGGGQQADQRGPGATQERPPTAEQLREEAEELQSFADGMRNNLEQARGSGADPREVADRQERIDYYDSEAASRRSQADSLEEAAETAEYERLAKLPSGSITNPDGTTTEIQRTSDESFRETRYDRDGNVINEREVVRPKGYQDFARMEPPPGER
jgi:hypothetical protein